MNRTILASAPLCALTLLSLLVSCGDYSADPPAAGGTSATGGSSGTVAGTGGAGTTAGTSTSGGTAGSGGGSGGAPGGSGGAPGGSGSGTGGSGGRETPPEATCDDPTACGGDATGVWFATSSCLNVSGMADLKGLGIGCPTGVATGKLTVTGNLTLGADGMYSDNTTTTGEYSLELAAACLNVSGTITQCPKISNSLGGLALAGIKCETSTVTEGGCTCKGTVDQMGSMGFVTFDPLKTGTHKSADGKLTLTTATNTTDYGYCVEGNFIKATPTTTTVLGDVVGTIVLQKQP